jgi:glyoxylase-like metal-dependent hydrolase (beta-lactamase superfamily II)
VFAGTPILAHEVTRAKLAELAGGGGETQISDLPTKAALFYGENFDTLVPPGGPERVWFERRFAAPEYAVLTIRPPTETFADRFAFHLPDDRVALAYFGPAHSDGDIVVHVARRRVLFLGDLFFFGRFPWLGDCDLDGWIATLDQVLALDVTTVVPGHGMPTTLKEVAAFRDLLADLRAAVGRAIAAGVSEEAAVREVTLPAYAAMPRYAEWLPFDVRSAYRYLRGSNPSS